MGKRLSSDIERVVLWADASQRYIQEAIGEEIKPSDQFDLAVGRCYNAISAGNWKSKNESEKADLISSYYALSKWKAWKTAYIFDPDFFEALKQTEDTQIRTEMLRRIPCPSFYVHAPNADNRCGYIFTIEPQDDGDCLILTLEVVKEANGDSSTKSVNPNSFGFKQCSLWLEDGETIASAMDRLMDSARRLDPNFIGDRDYWSRDDILERIAEDYLEPIGIAIMCAYYLSAQNADIKSYKVEKKDRPVRTNGTPLNVKAWEVGFRMGRAIGKMYQQERSEGKPHQGGTKRPHVRCAHWHHYRTGPGRTELTLKWLAPSIVNGGEKDIVAVGRRVIAKEE